MSWEDDYGGSYGSTGWGYGADGYGDSSGSDFSISAVSPDSSSWAAMDVSSDGLYSYVSSDTSGAYYGTIAQKPSEVLDNWSNQFFLGGIIAGLVGAEPVAAACETLSGAAGVAAEIARLSGN